MSGYEPDTFPSWLFRERCSVRPTFMGTLLKHAVEDDRPEQETYYHTLKKSQQVFNCGSLLFLLGGLRFDASR